MSGKKEESLKQELTIFGPSCSSRSKIEIPDQTNPLIAGEDFVSVGAAFCVIKQDEELADLVFEEYVLHSEETTKQLDELKRFLRLNKGVEKSNKKRDAKSAHAKSDARDGVSSDETDGSGAGAKTALDILNDLSVPSAMDIIKKRGDSFFGRESSSVSQSSLDSPGANIVPTPIVEIPL